MKLKTLLATLMVVSLTACNSGSNSTNSANGLNTAKATSTAATDMLKVAYIDVTGDVSAITASGYAAPNILVFAFADVTTNQMKPTWLANIVTAVKNEQPGALNFLSLGGQYGDAATFSSTGLTAATQHILAQIDSINSQLPDGKKINGVDLDLENQGWTPDMIATLAHNFKAAGLLVSVAPQLYTADASLSSDLDSANPTNLGMTSAGNSNDYQQAVASGDVDYIFAQTYNTSGWTIDGYSENQLEFFTAVSQALNNSVKDSCSATATSACIPSSVKIAIGEPSNGAASGNANNIFGSSGDTSYDQSSILAGLMSAWSNVQTSAPHISGIMEWSLNNDYNPSGFGAGDSYAKAGAFTSAIFGAALPPALPYFILQVSNTGTGGSLFATATLIINNGYYIFGANTANGQVPIADGQYQLWGTLPSSQNTATPGVVDSGNFDSIFSNGVTSFTTSGIYVNRYNSQGDSVNSPNWQNSCTQGSGYTFLSGHSYNLEINAETGACAINEMN